MRFQQKGSDSEQTLAKISDVLLTLTLYRENLHSSKILFESDGWISLLTDSKNRLKYVESQLESCVETAERLRTHVS